MTTPIRVDFHCHSTCSDGTLTPKALADRLAAGGVAFAALTDHDTLDGLHAFRKRLAHHGVGCLTGVEITTQFHGREPHLLAYGFDPDHPGLRAALAALRHSREPRPETIVGSIRHRRLQLVRENDQSAPDGQLDIATAIAIVHRAGGSAYLAHPLLLEPDPIRLEAFLAELKTAGLDGIEALYAKFQPAEQTALCEMAHRLGLLVCAGTDFHTPEPSPSQTPMGTTMPPALWKAFRNHTLSGSHRPTRPLHDRTTPLLPRSTSFILRIVLPSFIAMLLFAVALGGFILPAIERSLLDRKRELIRELVNSAWGILAEAEEEVRLGLTTPEASRDLARKRIATLRYGRDGKDYFWLQDMHPTIIMHPYRPELNGQDVSNFRDPRGVRIFVEFANLVRRQNEGFINYVWQWKDDPDRLVPKESYLRGFAPWGWIIGTGIYTEDVKSEISRFERHLIHISSAIAGLIALLLITVIRQSLTIERKRREAEESLRESTERYRALVEAANEGTLLVVDHRCRYANPALLRRLGYSAHEIELLELADLLPARPGNEEAWDKIQQLRQGEDHPDGIEALLQGRDGGLLECTLTFSRITYAGRDGLIVQARDITPRREPSGKTPTPRSGRATQPEDAADNVPAGILHSHDILQLQSAEAAALTRSIANAETAEDVIHGCRQTPALVCSLLANDTHPRQVTRTISTIADAATRRFLQLAETRQGPPPHPYVFLALGSQGRREMSLFADQDNAILYDDPRDTSSSPETLVHYFLDLGQQVCLWLDAAGYPFCRGSIMARNPKWCAPLSSWRHTVTDWIRHPEPQQVLESSIFLDFRPVYGKADLARSLRRHVNDTLRETPSFIPFLARDLLRFRPPPTRFMRRLQPWKTDMDLLDTKAILMPLGGMARLYALYHHLEETHTLDRLEALARRGLLDERSLRQNATTYALLLRLRLNHQADCFREGRPLDNTIDWQRLCTEEQTRLDHAFRHLATLRKKISYDFLGGT